MKNISLIILASILLSTLFLTACSPDEPSVISKTPSTPTQQTQPKYGGTFKLVGTSAMMVWGYPPELGLAGAISYAYPALETMVLSSTSGDYVPRLAAGYKINADKKSVTFTLRKGVKFHDGTDWNATVAKWNLDRSLKANPEGQTASWASIDIVDDYTIQVNLKNFDNTIMSTFTGSAGYMISPKSFEANGLEWARVNPVGTGPFKFVGYKRDINMDYTRNDNYWEGKPYLDGIQFVSIMDTMTQSLSLQRGEVDSISISDTQLMLDLQAKGFDTLSGTTALICLIPDSAHSDSPFADIRVRQAVEYAIDRKSITSSIGRGFWKATNQHCPTGYRGYNSDIEGREYNPSMAKQLLSQAGYPNGFNTSIIANKERFNIDSLTAIQSQLKAVGINAELQILTQGAWTEKETKGWQGLLAQSFGVSTNWLTHFPRFIANRAPHIVSTARPANFDKMLDATLNEVDNEAINTGTKKLVRSLYDDATTFPLWVTTQVRFLQKYVKNSGFYATGGILDWTPAKTWFDK